jgi:DNA repair exonuclease SbcCD ATPase subunit
MIYFKSIKWKNLLSTGNIFTEVVFDKHKTTLIVGENGAGKSTILDALSFGLYGKPFRKVNKNQLLNSINGKGAVVELEFSIGKKQYKIVRGIKPNVFEIYVDDNLIDQNADAKEYQEMLETQILKLNHKSFAQIVILGSASFVPFMQLPTAHRREIVEDLLDIQIFSTMNSLLKDKIAYNRIKATDADYKVKSNAEKIEMHKKHIESLKQNNDELIAQKQAQLEKVNGDIATANTEIASINAEIEQLSGSIADHDKVRNKLEKIQEIARKVDNRLEKIRKDIAFFETHDDCPTCRQGIEHEHKATILENNNSQVTEIEQGKEQLAVELDSVTARLSEITNISSTISTKNKAVSELLVQIRTWSGFVAQINKEIEDIGNNTKQIDANNEEIKTLKEALKLAIAEKEELAKDKQVYDIAASLLRDTGIKTKIIKQYVPIINKLINKYLAAMDFFVSFELNENFEETIKSRFRDEFTYDSFSEGEKMRIDLALLFAWRAVAKLRNSVSTNLLIMDEVFDSSLDSSGTDEFLKILNGLTTDTNTFIISHKGDQLFDKFEHVIKFEKHKNFSRIAS